MNEPRAILAEIEQRARRRFGQNFLTRPEIAARIARGAGVADGDRVVEIGPGLGMLTDALLAAGAQVTAIELDRDLAAYLRETRPELRLVESDALKVRWPELCEGGGWKVVANLPYNVGTAIVIELLRHPRTFASVTVMLQREVVERLLADPGDDAYGSLSVHVRSRARGQWLFGVPAGSFHPRPKVDSAVVRLDLLAEPDVGTAGAEAFEQTVRAAFAQRRKTVLNSLSSAFDRDAAARALTIAEIDPKARAEVLDLEAFKRLSAALVEAAAGQG